MTTLSMTAGNCGRGKGEESSFFEYKSSSSFGNELLLTGVWFSEKSKVRSGEKFRIVAAKARKWKKHDYPWPDDIDPHSGNPLKYLSYFKPLEEKPKPVTLAFEKPLVDLEKKIIEVNSCFLIAILLIECLFSFKCW